MKAAILAGGFGKRLRPLTESVPKPLVEVAGRPVMEWQMMWLKKCGISSFVILTGYLKEKMMSYLDSKKDELGIKVEYSIEPEPMGTGGAIKNAEKFLRNEETFMLFNGDTVTNIDHRKLALDGCIASIALLPLRSTFGVVHVEGSKVTRFDEKPLIKDYWMNSGIYLMSREIFPYLPKSGNVENTTFVELAAKKLLNGTKFTDVYYQGVDSIKDMEQATADLKSGRVFG